MSIRPDHWIRKMCLEQRMIEPFAEKQVRQGVISYGVSSYGYDLRIADEFKIFTNVNSTIVDPKHVDPASMVDFKGPVAVIPPNSFALGRSVEYFRIPRNVITICLGKCVTGDTRVVDAESGDWLPIEEFAARRRTRVASLDGWRLSGRAVSEHLDSGVQPVYLLRTRAGLEIKTTISHPFRTLAGWKQLGELVPGDRIAAARSLPWFGREEWPEHEATLLGLLLADGACHTPGSSPCYTTGDPRLVEVFEEVARRFGCEVGPAGPLGHRLVNHRGRGGMPARNRAYHWLERLGCAVPSEAKRIPGIVFRAAKPRVAAFLRALFSGDGSAYQSEDSVFLEYYSISKALVCEVRHLLLRFGILALVRERAVPSGGWCWRVQITDRDMIRRFSEEIGFIPGCRKQVALEGILERIGDSPRIRSNFDTLPREGWELLRRSARSAGRSLSSMGVPRTQPDQSVGLAVARRVAEATQERELNDLLDGDVFWDVVEAVTPVGPQRVFDLTVPGTHNFVANDLVVHNSTYARCGIITNVTPFEPEWEGYVTLEISNTTPLPAKVYANEGIAQVLFFESDSPCEVSYKDKAGKYQAQQGITLPRL
jgi:deoxycytidine triphosphate deaminase